MRQFTEAQVQQFRERLRRAPGILSALEAKIQPVREHYRIPDTGIATWGGFYACPKHSVTLEFDISNPLEYRCPVDGEILTGAPYEGAWWRLLNSANCEASASAALRWLLLGQEQDLDIARRILVDYARRYPSYEVHGGIPYNNPGKANAQTLCDSMWLKGLASAYDIIRDHLNNEDCALIERDLFHCGAEFLMTQRCDQIHNHECIVSSAVGILGIVLDTPEYLDFALDTPYGLRYQLQHAVLPDGFWFEGTPSYHFYAMEQFIDFERFAAGQSYSFFLDPRFVEILKFPLRLLQPDGMLPLLNDSGHGKRGFNGTENLYELAYARTGDDDFARMLRHTYQGRSRENRYAFFDGVETLPEAAPAPLTDYHAQAAHSSGLTTLHGPDQRFLLFKHSPYGGEHDHYDRLGLHFLALGQYAAPDIGTSQYGAPLHYGYYKNTASHNTVCLNGQNQPPVDCRVLSFEKTDDYTDVTAEAAWDGSYQMLDSFTIKQWSEKAYAGARFVRRIRWYGDFFIDCFDVSLPEERDIAWTLHVRGAPGAGLPLSPDRVKWAKDGAGQYIHDVKRLAHQTPVTQITWDIGGDARLSVYSVLNAQQDAFLALGPDNPSIHSLSYLLESFHGKQARFLNVICAERKEAPVLASVEWTQQGLLVKRANGQEIIFMP